MQKVLIFWTKFDQETYFWSKTDKADITIEVNNQISLTAKFHFK